MTIEQRLSDKYFAYKKSNSNLRAALIRARGECRCDEWETKCLNLTAKNVMLERELKQAMRIIDEQNKPS